MRLRMLGLSALTLITLRIVSSGRFALLDAGGEATAWLLRYHTFSKLLLVFLPLAFILAFFRRASPGLADGRHGRLLWQLALVLSVVLLMHAATLPEAAADRSLSALVRLRYAFASTLLVCWQCLVFALVLPRALLAQRGFVLVFTLSVIALAFVTVSGIGVEVVKLFQNAISDVTLTLTGHLLERVLALPVAVTQQGTAPVISSMGFTVIVGTQCAGYEGMLAAGVLLGSYCALDATHLRWPRVGPLIVLVAAAVFAMNAVRIAALVYIGAVHSPEIALNGFHSYFGSLSLLALVGSTIGALHHPWFRVVPANGGRPARHEDHAALRQAAVFLTPLAFYLLAKMLAGSFQGDFDWLYPLPVLLGIAMLFRHRTRIARALGGRPSARGFVVGVLVFVGWVLIVPHDPAASARFAAALYAEGPLVLIVWLAFRVVGTALVVPLLEELAFRGGLQPLLAAGFEGRVPASLSGGLALTGTALAFGLLHGDLIAASLAGAAYGGLVLRGGRLADAVLAHGVTNFMLSVYALAFARWSYW